MLLKKSPKRDNLKSVKIIFFHSRDKRCSKFLLRCEKEMSKHFAFFQFFSQTDQITEEMGNKDVRVGEKLRYQFQKWCRLVQSRENLKFIPMNNFHCGSFGLRLY